VLLVEDDHDIRVSIRALLEAEGYEVLTVTNGRGALELLQSTTPAPRLIILDLSLPVMDGWQFANELQRLPRLGHIPVVVMSAAPRDRLPSAGIVGRLAKPIDVPALLRVVAEHCRGPRPSVTRTSDDLPSLPDDDRDDELDDEQDNDHHET
jgi:CheY-like chemotaxis protein